MGESSRKARKIDLGDDFGDVVVKANGATIKVEANSHVIASTRGGVELQAAANDYVGPKAESTAPEIGDEMADGTVLAGYYEGKPLFARPRDESGTYTFNEAAKYAERLNAQKYLGHDDWRVPSKGELNVLFENRNQSKLKGTFNETGSYPAGWYWSSTPGDYDAWAQRFSDGHQKYDLFRDDGSSLRLVR